MEMKNDLNGLKEEAKIYEREILSMLLEVSKSFTTDEMTKEKREENFSKIDELREKLKSVSKVIEDIENTGMISSDTLAKSFNIFIGLE